jgi:hypothetical protein
MGCEPLRRWTFRLTVQTVIAWTLIGGMVRATTVTSDLTSRPRVRSSDPYIRAMVDEAARRSATFRRLTQVIEATNGIVYVEQGACGHSVRACLTFSVTPAGDYRILRVLVDARQPDWEVMASIGHELQHTTEVLSNPLLTSTEAVYLFYSREWATLGDAFETPEAIRVGRAVRNEVGSYAKGRAN